VTGSGITAPGQTVRTVDVSSLSTGTLRVSVTLNSAGVAGVSRIASVTGKGIASGILDMLSAKPALALSVRQLSNSYAGPLIDVRRARDGQTASIYPMLTGDLDVGTLLSFCAGTSCFVSKWYDQSGSGRHFTQLNPANQPRIVRSGSLDRFSGSLRPQIRFYGTVSGVWNSLSPAGPITAVGTATAVVQFAIGGDGFLFGNQGLRLHYHSDTGAGKLFGSYTSSKILNGTAWVNGAQVQPRTINWPRSLQTISLQPQTPTVGTEFDNIGSDRNCCHYTNLGSGYSEIAVFASPVANADRQALELSQGAYFGFLVQ
jgi:hypothetical protein